MADCRDCIRAAIIRSVLHYSTFKYMRMLAMMIIIYTQWLRFSTFKQWKCNGRRGCFTVQGKLESAAASVELLIAITDYSARAVSMPEERLASLRLVAALSLGNRNRKIMLTRP